jgi:hypothetical protein
MTYIKKELTSSGNEISEHSFVKKSNFCSTSKFDNKTNIQTPMGST